MKKSDWLLLAIGEYIQPIQLQKTLFKFAKESAVPAAESYEFEPYNWGPCSFEIYDDLGSLREQGLIEAIPSGSGWNIYRLTELGKVKSIEFRKQASASLVRALDDVRSWVTSRDFETLLRDVYKDYPKYATESLFMKS